ncbi:MAG TPA: type II 3-dehydroquinate dehydratase [Pedobacter sp.]|jgi:3-dehydroquinate dehydratase-2
MKIQIINGPNLNLLGTREKSIYGESGFEPFLKELSSKYPAVEFSYYQSNVEGELINKLHEVGFTFDGVIMNAGAYTHTSIGISDAIAGINTPVVEVHISNVYAREEYRHVSLMAKNCKGIITGFGLKSYELALLTFYNTTGSRVLH